jgi:hypothetical protein
MESLNPLRFLRHLSQITYSFKKRNIFMNKSFKLENKNLTFIMF